ncbi:c-type cytochrome [Vannielia litorea]|uniref:c-type cytochrome n=1 Tax=Vannielia litorea TaxID=1217970 RepID=UPI001C973EC6|nr:cytochrome c family protein [Vannielia litorea]MBY6049124.1 cytochrome c family protein [Vannielia litorea]MBY6076538.1 cytochrome c family protein [Vannielia litorea]
MFDTMTMVKAFGWFCGALLIYLLINWAGESLYAMDAGGHGEEGEEHAMGYAIEVADSGEGAEAEEDTGPAFEEVFASADAASGEKVFGKCKACHKLDGTDGTGPHLNGVVNRAIGSVAGFGYSDAMASHGGEWTPEALSEFLANPKGYMNGTKMSFAGLRKIEDRADVIAYLQSAQ